MLLLLPLVVIPSGVVRFSLSRREREARATQSRNLLFEV